MFTQGQIHSGLGFISLLLVKICTKIDHVRRRKTKSRKATLGGS